jgi:hypothetical protein
VTDNRAVLVIFVSRTMPVEAQVAQMVDQVWES